MFQYIEETRTKPSREIAQDLAVDWTRIFRGVAPGYGPPPPYEAVYIGEDNQENSIKVLLEMTKEYSSLGLFTNCQYSRLDYAGIQLAFLHHLCSQEIKLLEGGNQTEAIKYKSHYSRFAAEHLGKWTALRF
ncbi:MAG: molecular chaperone TorD family protein [Desulfosporosinus fructosivorans]